jgi:hypothetical protein
MVIGRLNALELNALGVALSAYVPPNIDAVADMAFGSPRPLSSTREHRSVTITAL